MFAYAVVTALLATCILLSGLMAGWSRSQTFFMLIGCLIVAWAVVFSFLEVNRLATHSTKITGPDEVIDPDAPRRIVVEPPTGEATPHHEFHVGSPGLDQGQLTSQLPDATPLIDRLLGRGRRKRPQS